MRTPAPRQRAGQRRQHGRRLVGRKVDLGGGAELVVRAPPDGYTLLSVGTPDVINGAFYQKLSFNVTRDITPVAGIGREPNLVVVNPAVPATTVPEFIAYVKANPGKLSLGVGGIGTTGHVAGELFRMMTGADLIIVPYRGGGPALTDLLAGVVHIYIGPASASIDHVRAGKLRALAVTTATRSASVPDISAMAEFLPGYEASTFFGIEHRARTHTSPRYLVSLCSGLASNRDQSRRCRRIPALALISVDV